MQKTIKSVTTLISVEYDDGSKEEIQSLPNVHLQFGKIIGTTPVPICCGSYIQRENGKELSIIIMGKGDVKFEMDYTINNFNKLNLE